MTYRVVWDRAGAALGQKEFLPHLVCSWTLDPASHRLSCAWAPPAERRDIAFLSARITTSNRRPGFALAEARVG
jgi:hypothetical protein